MAKKVIHLSASEFFTFLRAHEMCVIRVRSPFDQDFSKTLSRLLEDRFGGKVAAACIEPFDFGLAYKQHKGGSSLFYAAPPGYYLFGKDSLITYSAGTIDLSFLDGYQKVAAMFVGLFELGNAIDKQGLTGGLRATTKLLEEAQGLSIFQYFLGHIEAKLNAPPEDALRRDLGLARSNAYKFFGLSENCSDSEVKRAHRLKLRDFHPDTGGGDSEYLNEKTKIINLNYELIMNARKKK